MSTLQRITERAMLVYRSLSGWSGRRFDKSESREVTRRNGAEDDAARVNKLVVPASLLKPIEQHDGEWQRWHESMTLPYPAKGYAILLSENFLAYTDGTSQRRTTRQQLVRELERQLPAALVDAPKRLGGLLKPGDLPTPSEIVKKYKEEVVFLPFPEANQLTAVIDDEVRRQTSEYLDNSVVAAAMRDVWQRVYDAVAHMVDRLNAKSNDPASKLYASVVGNIEGLVELLPKLNLTGDGQLEAMRQRLSEQLTIHTVDELKEDDVLRQSTADAAQRILDAMKGYVA
jgi:hypothetical protein